MNYQQTVDARHDAAAGPRKPFLTQPFSFAFVLCLRAQPGCDLGTSPAPVRGYRHLSDHVLCFEMPDDAEATLAYLPPVDRATIRLVRWEEILRMDVTGFLYVRPGRQGTTYALDQTFLAPSTKEYEREWFKAAALLSSYCPKSRSVIMVRDLSRTARLFPGGTAVLGRTTK